MTTESLESTPLPAAGTYRMDPQRSTVAYSGRHMFGLGVVHATFEITSGELRIGDPPAASSVMVTIDANSFASGNAKRDSDVRAAALLDTATYPSITFTSDTLQWAGEHWLLSGTATAHSVSVPVQLVIERVSAEHGSIRVQAHAKHLDRYAFGVTRAKGMVGRHLDLNFDIHAVQA
jgi:polyisoprenoid-binding protein YceI